jgi:hypothetical protein
MDTKHSDEEVVHAALDSLLEVVAKSADDLRNFHDALTQLRVEGKTPFPRIVVTTANSVVEHLTKVEEQLKKITIAAGL